MKVLNLLEGGELIPLPAPTCDKSTGSVWEVVAFLTVTKKELIYCRASPKFLLFIPKFKGQAWDKKLLEPPPAYKFKYRK